MKNKKILLFSIVMIAATAGVTVFINNRPNTVVSNNSLSEIDNQKLTPTPTPHPMDIDYLRQQNYPGSKISIYQTLESGSNFNRYLAFYQSQGNRINGLLTGLYEPQCGRASGWYLRK